MAVTFVNASGGGNGSGGTTVGFVVPSGIQLGDLMLVGVSHRAGTGGTISNGVGFTQLDSQRNSTTTLGAAIFYKFAISDDVSASSLGSTYNFNVGANAKAAIACLVLRGPGTATDIIASLGQANASAGTVAYPALTAANYEALAVFLSVANSGTIAAVTNFTAPAAGTGASGGSSSTANRETGEYRIVSGSNPASGSATLGTTGISAGFQVAVKSAATNPTGTASGSISLTGTATATASITATSSATLALSGASTAGAPVSGSGAGDLALTGAATGVQSDPAVTGTGNGTITLSGSGTTSVPVQGTAFAPLALAGGANASVSITGGGTAVLPLSGTTTASVAANAVVSGTLPLTGSAATSSQLIGDCAGTLSFTGAGVGNVPVSASAGYGTLALADSAAASAEVRGAGASPFPLQGSASTQAGVQAQGSGFLTLSGMATAETTVTGLSSGVIQLGDAGLAGVKILGTASGLIVISGTGSALAFLDSGPYGVTLHVAEHVARLSLSEPAAIAGVRESHRASLHTRWTLAALYVSEHTASLLLTED